MKKFASWTLTTSLRPSATARNRAASDSSPARVLVECAPDRIGLGVSLQLGDLACATDGLAVNRVLEPLDHGLHVRQPPFDGFKTLLDRRCDLIGCAGIQLLIALEPTGTPEDPGESERSPFQRGRLLARRLTPPHSGPGYFPGLGSTCLGLGPCALGLPVHIASLGNRCTQPLHRALPITVVR